MADDLGRAGPHRGRALVVMDGGWPRQDLLEALSAAGFGHLISSLDGLGSRQLRPGDVDVCLTAEHVVEADLGAHVAALRLRANAPVACCVGAAALDRARAAGADLLLVDPVDEVSLTMLGDWLRASRGRRVGWGPLQLDLLARTARWAGVELHATTQQFALLRTLVEAQGGVVSIGELASRMYGTEVGDDHDRVVAHVRRIRRLVEVDSTCPTFLLTVRGLGFRLAATAERAHSHAARVVSPAALDPVPA